MEKFVENSSENLVKVRRLNPYMERHKGFIAGGCFKNIFQNENIKDVDIFFNSESDFNEAVELFKGDEDNYVFSYENKNTIAYKNKFTHIRVELIKSVFGTPQEIISKFDFSVAKFAYYKHLKEDGGLEYKIIHTEKFFEDLVNKKLVLNVDILFPVSTWERSYRYGKYGFGLCRESKINLLEALRNVNTDDVSQSLYFGFD